MMKVNSTWYQDGVTQDPHKIGKNYEICNRQIESNKLHYNR